MIVTIDGPAGSGKSTVARKLANKLGFIHLNSGALFRAVGIRAAAAGLALDDDQALGGLAAGMSFEFRLVHEDAEQRTKLLVDGADIAEEIRGDTAGQLASRIGLLPSVRQALLEVQRRTAEGKSVVLEGRDAGTVVFPYAEVKFYLDAALEVRAERRFLELAERSSPGEISREGVLRDMQARDQREFTRDIAPLKPAADAIVVDTTALSIDEVVERLRRLALEKASGRSENAAEKIAIEEQSARPPQKGFER